MGRDGTFATAAMASGFAPFAPALAAGGPFDGVWDVQLNCPTTGDVEGYAWRFPAEVSSSFFSDLFHSTTSSAVGHITGQIHPDGGALLMMFGRTGPPQRAVGYDRPGTPFRYVVDAHFYANDGSGKRNEQRPCALTFNKT